MTTKTLVNQPIKPITYDLIHGVLVRRAHKELMALRRVRKELKGMPNSAGISNFCKLIVQYEAYCEAAERMIRDFERHDDKSATGIENFLWTQYEKYVHEAAELGDDLEQSDFHPFDRAVSTYYRWGVQKLSETLYKLHYAVKNHSTVNLFRHIAE